MSDTASRRGWTVTLAGTGINLALGILYSWSVISKEIPAAWGWSETARAWPYTIACLMFAFMMVPAGRLQDVAGPRLVASLGGILTGLGLLLASSFTTLGMFILGFGILAGTGIGFGYASATPPAVKWFPPARTGLVTGIVVSGFGLASVYIAPLVKHLIQSMGIQSTLGILGGAFMVAVVILSQFLVNPPVKTHAGAASSVPERRDLSGGEVLRRPEFYLLWLMYAFNAGAGLMIIGKLAKLVEVQAGFKAGFVLVALLAIGNAGGRLLAGSMSDRFGRLRVLQVFAFLQMLLMFVTPSIHAAGVLIILAMCIGMSYGANLSVFPSITKDYFGLKHFGTNYGLVFTAWGVGSLLALVAGKIYDVYQVFDYALYLAGVLLIVSLALSWMVGRLAERSTREAAAESAVPRVVA